MLAGLRRRLTRSTALALAIAAMASVIAFAENIDPNNDNSQFAYGENIGWINFEPSQGPGVTLSLAGMSGYAWGENIGWINLNCRNNPSTCATTKSYGVVRDGTKLAGYAWAENVGWISFSCLNKINTCASTGNYGVTLNTTTNVLSGRAWAENAGWITFSGASPAFQVQAGTNDNDGDSVIELNDDCPFDADSPQVNSDRNFTLLPHPRYGFDDLTRINSDGWGDVCDTDDDNDGLSDTTESGGPPCVTATGPTSAANADTDGDTYLDGAECALGTNPNDPSSHPPYVPPVNIDADRDGLPDSFEPLIGADPAKRDTDGDFLTDGVEFMFYNSDPASLNTDFDACGDSREAASVNQDQTINSGDIGAVASAFGPRSNPNYVLDFDFNKDGTITSGDIGFTASRFGPCP